MAAPVNRDRLVAHFLDLVRIDSPSFHEHEVARRLEGELRALGLTVANDRSGPGDTGNVVAVLPGERGMALALSAHLDTVEPGRGVKPRIEDGIVRSDGTTILGADCKAGIAIVVEAVRQVLERRLPHGRLELLLTYGEERGHAGAKTLDLAPCRARLAVVLDGVGPPGTVLSRSPSYESFRATFRGVAAHAGVEPEKGRSAILEAAHQVLALHALNGRWPSVTVNAGVIEGGTRPNVVAERCELKVDLRAATVDAFDAAAAAVERIAASPTVDGVSATVERIAGHPPMEKSDASARLVDLAISIAGDLGFALADAATGGASDANTCAALGVPTLDGLGPVGGDDHSVDEWLDLSTVVPRTTLLASLIGRIDDATG